MKKSYFDTPAHLIDLNKTLSVKEIKYILENLTRERFEYSRSKAIMEKFGAKMPEIDFDSIEALQTIFKYCNNKIILNKLAHAFNKYVKVDENIGLYEPYFGEDKIYSYGYDLEVNFPKDLKGKIINLSNKILQQEEEKEREFYM